MRHISILILGTFLACVTYRIGILHGKKEIQRRLPALSFPESIPG